jgi:ubiquitin-protein ligase E3 C
MMPNPHYFQEDLKKYELVGKIIGKAMYEGVIIEPVLARFFLNKVLNVKNSFNELRYYDKDVY